VQVSRHSPVTITEDQLINLLGISILLEDASKASDVSTVMKLPNKSQLLSSKGQILLPRSSCSLQRSLQKRRGLRRMIHIFGESFRTRGPECRDKSESMLEAAIRAARKIQISTQISISPWLLRQLHRGKGSSLTGGRVPGMIGMIG